MRFNKIAALAAIVAVSALSVSARTSKKASASTKKAKTTKVVKCDPKEEAAKVDATPHIGVQDATWLYELGKQNAIFGDMFKRANQTQSGLKYVTLTEGTGIQPGPTDEVTVHYTGYLPDGTIFDSSIDRGEPTSFPLNRVIAGWTEGLQLMKEGGQTAFYIPSELAYGKRGTPGGPIRPDQDLIFVVELLKVKK